METNSFILLKLHTPISNGKLKQMVPYLTVYSYSQCARGVYFSCCFTILRLRYLPSSLLLIKGLKEYNQETKIKIVNFADNTTIFSRDIICLNRVQVILRLYENPRINQLKYIFKNPSLYGVVHLKTEFINQGSWNNHNFH